MGLTYGGKHTSLRHLLKKKLLSLPTLTSGTHQQNYCNFLRTVLFLAAAARRLPSTSGCGLWRSGRPAGQLDRADQSPSQRPAAPALPLLSASQPKLPIQTGVRSSRQPVAAAPSPPREGDGDGQRRLRRLRAPVALLAGRRTLAPLSRIHVNCSECVLWPPLQCPTHARSNSSDALTWLWLLMFRYRPRDRCLGEQQLELPQQVRFCSRNC